MGTTKKQTAVGWLVGKLKSQGLLIGDPDNLIAVREAKEMEKEQIVDAFWNGDNTDCLQEQNSKEFAEQYYTETYETN